MLGGTFLLIKALRHTCWVIFTISFILSTWKPNYGITKVTKGFLNCEIPGWLQCGKPCGHHQPRHAIKTLSGENVRKKESQLCSQSRLLEICRQVGLWGALAKSVSPSGRPYLKKQSGQRLLRNETQDQALASTCICTPMYTHPHGHTHDVRSKWSEPTTRSIAQ